MIADGQAWNAFDMAYVGARLALLITDCGLPALPVPKGIRLGHQITTNKRSSIRHPRMRSLYLVSETGILPHQGQRRHPSGELRARVELID
jgi:hypothetical protein